MARNYAALPHEYLKEMDALNDAEFGRLARALLKYSITGEPIALCGNERFYANRVMNQEDKFQANYEEQSKTLSDRGKAGATARWSKNAQACLSMQSNACDGNTETETNTKTDSVKEKVIKKKNFEPPTLEEVKAYCIERGNDVDPRRFHDYYSAGDWKDGKGNPVKNWKQKLLTWEKQGNKSKSSFLIDSIRRDIDATGRSQGLLIADADALDILQSSAN